MAKKNSTKTATKEAMQASEPRLQTFTGWQGINIKESPLGWEPLESNRLYAHHQTDLKPNYFLLQNNMVTNDSLTVETRPDSIKIGAINPVGMGSTAKFTGVACLFHKWLFVVIRRPVNDGFTERVYYRDITKRTISTWRLVQLKDAEEGLFPTNYEITELGYYEEQLIALTRHPSDDSTIVDEHNFTKYEGEIFTAELKYYKNPDTGVDGISVGILKSAILVDNPSTRCNLTVRGDLKGNTTGEQVEDEDGIHYLTTRIEICFVYTNKYGSTMPSDLTSMYVEHNPVTWSANRYLQIDGTLPSNQGITGIDIYCSLDENQDEIFIGHVEIKPNQTTWKYNWLGAMSDTTQWTNVQLQTPTENTTKGVPATHFANHDSRLYFWGDPDHPYRLYIGGNPGSELSIARGLGGAFVDIEPGSGIEIKGTAKWKTVQGANIITMMCGNPNTNKVKRFNLVETNMTITNEIASRGYMYEEVSNVVGCNSRWGYGVFADGLYSVHRYGVMLTTMAMEYNSQMRNQQVSDVIQPVFTERLGNRVNDARMVYIDDVLYLILSEDERLYNDIAHQGSTAATPTSLDRVILCYDLNLKAWYTFTHDGSDELLLHAMAIDSEEYIEGLGIISETEIYLYPTTGIQDETVPEFTVLLETGELASRQPLQQSTYIQQIEFRFDYLISDPDDPPTILVEGVDYYGRPFAVYKKINIKSRGHHGKTTTMRDYQEWVRIEKLVESYRIRIIGKVRCRMTHFISKLYTSSNKIGLPYGYDARDTFKDRQGNNHIIHHYIDDYNNLRRAIVT